MKEIKKLGFSDVKITGGFWKEKQRMVKDVTIDAVYNRFKETGRFDAFKCTWKEGDPIKPHIFWDSDVAKWIEGVSYCLMEKRDDRLESIIEEVVDNIIKNSDENGYFNSYFLVTEQDKRFKVRNLHELYCFGHLIEAAVAYYNATGKDRFLKAMCRYADYVEKVFKIEKSAGFITPGHPELELALIKLYEATGEKRYFDLAAYFIDEHGNNDRDDVLYEGSRKEVNQDEMPLKDRDTLEGHSVRALYLLSGAADVAKIRKDKQLFDACRRTFYNTVNKRMYITGGVGSTHIGEAFTIDYDLPSRTAYAETCAAIALAMFAGRMQNAEINSVYADTVERVIYNGFLSGVSMKGNAFFYENPLEIDPDFNVVDTSSNNKRRYPITQRKEVFDCSCCPPNAVRFIPSISGFMYGYTDDTLYIHQYMESDADCDGMKIVQKTDYPSTGKVKIIARTGKKTALRIPSWCRNFSVDREYTMENGYAIINGDGEINITFDMTVNVMRANPNVHDICGKVAVMRGPVVYCAEGIDNGKNVKDIRISPYGEFKEVHTEFLLPGLVTTGYKQPETDSLYYLAGDNWQEVQLTLIPYYAFANRGESEMHVWLLEK